MIDVGVLFQQPAAALRRERDAPSEHDLDTVAPLGPHLDALGVSDTSLSPCFRCGRPAASTAPITDHNAFSPEIGDMTAFDRAAASLAARGLDLILDAEPNDHMGIPWDANPAVPEDGQASLCPGFFEHEGTAR